MASKYNHHKFETYSCVNVADYALKKRGFLASLSGSYLIDNDLLLSYLVQYYCDLNNLLKRLSAGFHDYMFMRFVYKAKAFYFQDRFSNLLELWDEAFSLALEIYVKDRHNTFVQTYGISYVAFFDINFSNTLYFTFIDLEYKYKKLDQEVLFSDIPDVSCYLTDGPPEYRVEFDQELVSRSFAPSLLTIP